MKNVLYFDSLFNVQLLKNEEQQENSIVFVIDADNTYPQVLEIVAGSVVETHNIIISEENTYVLPTTLWNLGDVTTVALKKGGSAIGTVTLTFPKVVDTDASLNQTSVGHYTMQGSDSIKQQIINLQESIENISSQVVDYILPTDINQDPIEDGSNADVLTFAFYSSVDGEKTSFYSCVVLDIATTVDETNDIYNDCRFVAVLTLDGVEKAVFIETYGDGEHVLMMNFLLDNLSKGGHVLKVNFRVEGGSIA